MHVHMQTYMYTHANVYITRTHIHTCTHMLTQAHISCLGISHAHTCSQTCTTHNTHAHMLYRHMCATFVPCLYYIQRMHQADLHQTCKEWKCPFIWKSTLNEGVPYMEVHIIWKCTLYGSVPYIVYTHMVIVYGSVLVPTFTCLPPICLAFA